MKVAGCGAVVNRGLVIGFVVLFVVLPCAGRVITVDDDGPADFNTIQAAIDDVNSEGTVIVVAPGVYQENVGLGDWGILLTSSNPDDEEVIKGTVIDGGGSGPAVSFWGYDTGSELRGFSITGGGSRGAIICYDASGIISKCIIRDNPGDGIMMWRGRIDNCLIVSNGDYGIRSETATIVNTTIAGNSRGGLCGYGGNVQNCILWGNREPQIMLEGSRGGGEYPSIVMYSCVQGGYEGDGNIDSEPQFLDANGGDYRLGAGSACIDAGIDTWPIPLARTDLAGNYRQIDGDGDGEIVVDMGCYEYGIVTMPAILAQPREPIFTGVERGTNPDAQSIYISNIGVGTVNWEIDESCSWLSVSPVSGSSAGEVNEVVVSVDIWGLGPGRHVCELTVVDGAASNSPVTISVNCVVLEEGTINVPFDYPTIQQAVDAAGEGDTVVIAPGRYTGWGNFGVDLYDKRITVRGAEPSDPAIVAATVVDCDYTAGGFSVSFSEDGNRAIEGLTVINGYGSGIFWEGRGRISNCVVSNCCGEKGGGIYIRGNLPISTPGPTVSKCVIKGNSATGWRGGGGGIYCEGAYATIIDCEIAGNYAVSSGGGIYSRGAPTITRCVIRDNRADGTGSIGGGGGIYCRIGSSWITDCVIENNRAVSGGGIFTPYIIYRSGLGVPPQKTIIRDCVVTGNVATYRGAGILCSNGGGPDYIIGCRFYGNKTEQGNGGGAYCEWAEWDSSGASFANCVFSGNIAENGGGLYSENARGQSRITNCTFSSNAADGEGGGLWMVKPWVVNSIFWGNTAGSGDIVSAQILGDDYFGKVEFSCIQDADPNDSRIPFSEGDSNNIDDDPMFVRNPDDGGDGWGDDPETPYVDEGANDDYGDLHLRQGSPCINGGPVGWAAEPNSVDMDGKERIIGPAVDMGADEYSPMIVVTRPQTGEMWLMRRTYAIEWESWGVGTVDILFSKDGQSGWKVIERDVNNIGSYLWDVPGGKDSNECSVSVVGSGDESDVVSIPSGEFAISHFPHRVAAPPGPVRRRRDLGEVLGPEVACVKWMFDTGGPVSSAAVILGSNADRYNVYIGCEDGRLYVLDSTGTLVWNYDTGSGIVGSPAVGNFGLIYIGAEDGRVHAVDRKRGLRWTYSTGGPIYASPVVGSDRRLYVCSEDGTMHALGMDGTEQWCFEMGLSTEQSGAIYATPAIGDDGTAYIGGRYDPNLYALEPNDGSVKWACNFEVEPDLLLPPDDPRRRGKSGWPVAGPAIGPDGTLYQVLADDSSLYAIDAHDGSILWSQTMAPYCSRECEWFGLCTAGCGQGCASVMEDYVDCLRSYKCQVSSQLIDRIEHWCGDWYGIGPLDWGAYDVNYAGSSGWSSPAVGPDGTIYVSFDDPYLRAVEPNGTIKWITKLGEVGGFTLTVDSGGYIYAAGDDGYLSVISPDGDELARFEGDGYLSHPVLAPDGTLIVSDGDNRVWAISDEACDGQGTALHRPADLNGDGVFNFVDFAMITAQWRGGSGVTAGDRRLRRAVDINRDSSVDMLDLVVLANQWMCEE